MMVQSITPVTGGASSPTGTTRDAATNAFGLGFEDLLKIILTQLTYQDPLKPMDNFEFVSQLAQFSQIQIAQTGNDRLAEVAVIQANANATGLLGRTVDIGTSPNVISGKVVSIALDNGQPRLTIKTNNSTISNIAVSAVTQIRESN